MESFKRIFSYAHKDKQKLIMSVIFATVSVLMGLMPYVLLHRMVMHILDAHKVNMHYAAITAGSIVVCLWAKSIFFAKATIYSHECAYDILMGMRNQLAEKMIKMPMGELQKRTTGHMKSIFIDDIESMEIALAHMIPEMISNVLAPALLLMYLSVLDIRMAVLSLITLPLGYLFYALMMKGNGLKVKQFFKATDHMNGTIIEYINGMEVIKTFNQTTSSFAKYTHSVHNYKKFALDWYHHSWPYMTAYAVILPCSLLFVLPFGALFYMQETLSLSIYFLSILLSLGVAAPLMKLLEHMDTLGVIGEKEKKIHDLLHSPEIEAIQTVDHVDGYTITFDHITFGYGAEAVLKDISFIAKENTVTALVGPSGSGKSTLAQLLMRFWDVQQGEIKIDTVNIKNLSFGMLMDGISYVSQDIYLFNQSIMDNIRIGKQSASDEEVMEAAKLAQCHDFIIALQDGYHTMVGDAGNKLSGGQKQRISIARALLKDAPIVILDEATAFTDPENEDKIQNAINQLMHHKTLIVIAHRLSTIIHADNIVVLDQGKIVQEGTHLELLEKCQFYKKMWELHVGTINWQMSVKEVHRPC